MLELGLFTTFGKVYILSFVAIFGLIIGSFLNVVGLRLLSDESIVFPCSKCPKCNTPIKWYDNIPVFSYIFLGGKCRNCKTHISIQYPIVEALTSFMFVACFLKFGFSIITIFMIVLMCFFMIICITDMKEQLVYDWVSYPIIPIGILFNVLGLNFLIENKVAYTVLGLPISQAVVESLMGIALAYVFFEVVSRSAKLFLGERAFGEGDTDIAMGIGAFLGWKSLIPVIVLSFIVQVIVGVPIMIFQSIKEKDYKSLGAYMGLIIALAIPMISNQLGFSSNYIVAILTLIITMIIALISGFYIISSAKEKQSYTFLPFGPALILGAIAVIFFADTIKQFINF